MVDDVEELTRLCCCRRHAYIYLYSPKMTGSSSFSSRCLVGALFSLCLVLVVVVTGLVVYHQTGGSVRWLTKTTTSPPFSSVAKKRQLPDFVNADIDPCEHFYEFVCDKWTRRNKIERYGNRNESQTKWNSLRHAIHDRLMSNKTQSSEQTNRDNRASLSFIRRFYQLCETQSSSLLLDELDRYVANFLEQDPYRSHFTLLNRTNSSSTSPPIFQYNPFFTILNTSLENDNQSLATIGRSHLRPLPSPFLVFSNSSKFNRTALDNLVRFDQDYRKVLSEETRWIAFYEKEYHEDSLIVKRILSFGNYTICLPTFNSTNGLDRLIELLTDFLHSRLRQFNAKLIGKQIYLLHEIRNNHTLVEHLRRIQLELTMIEQIVSADDDSHHTNKSCLVDLLDRLLDRRMQVHEVPLPLQLYAPNDPDGYFISEDWPFLSMLHDRLLSKTPVDTLVNYLFFDRYQHLVYPYYQPQLARSIDFPINHEHVYDGSISYSNQSCSIQSCLDTLNCYHPSFLNELMNEENQISLETIRIKIQTLIDRLRVLVEQSDYLHFPEKKLIIKELSQMQILLGHYKSAETEIPVLDSVSYLDHVKLLSRLPNDRAERSYQIEPIYDHENQTLFIPYGFLYLSNDSIEYSLLKLLLTIVRRTVQSNPFNIECFIKSSDDTDATMINANDEHLVYLLLRSKFQTDRQIIMDEYLWPFMSANTLMKRFLIDYAAFNYCPSSNGYETFTNNSYLTDDIHLVFHCPQASLIKQSKCTVT